MSVLGLSLLCLALFFLKLGSVPLFDLDEGLYATCAREMARTGDWVTPRLNSRPPFQPSASSVAFFEKPILIYWLSAIAMRLLGATPLSARLPVALAALFMTALVTWTGWRWFGARAGLLAGLVYATAPLTVLDARQLTTDGLLVLWLTSAVLAFQSLRESVMRSERREAGRFALLFWISSALAILTKGAVGMLLPCLVIAMTLAPQNLALWWRSKRAEGPEIGLQLRLSSQAIWRPVVRALHIPAGLLFVLVLVAPWHGAIWMAGGRDELGHTWVQEYLIRQHIGRFKGLDTVHNAPLPSYLLYFLIGFFPWACFTTAAYRYRDVQRQPDANATFEPAETLISERRRFLLVWFWTIFVFFSLAAAKLPTYIVPAYPAAALLVGRWLARAITSASPDTLRSLRRGSLAATVTGALLVTLALIGPRFAPPGSPIPEGVVRFVSHFTLLIAVGSGLSWLCFLKGGRPAIRAGVLMLALTPALLTALAFTEGYSVAADSILGPYQRVARDALPDARRNLPIVYYHIIPRRPSMLFYGGYSPLERKETPLLPYLAQEAPESAEVDVVTSYDTYVNLILPELRRGTGVRSSVLSVRQGWVLVRLSRRVENSTSTSRRRR